jgi:hypothetical protein
VALRHIKRSKASRISHQVLHSAGEFHRKKTPALALFGHAAQAPQSIIKAVRLKNHRQR